jgi:RNA polymerase sigma-70 factor, ECF subfamily
MSTVEAVRSTTAEETLQGLYERHADRVFGFCRNRLRSQQEAEDATQTTFLNAFRALQRGTFPVSETAWLFKIAENVCFAAHRSNGRRSARELADGSAVIDLAPALEDRQDALFGLDEALAAIPDRQRHAFVLRELRGLSNREIAGQIGVSVTAVEMLVFRARRSLARALDNGGALKGRVAGLLDLGAILNLLKTGVAGATAAKVVATAAVVAVSALPAGDSAAPRERTAAAAAVTVPAERIGQRPVSTAVEKAERAAARPDRAVERPASSPGRSVPGDPGPGPGRPGPGKREEHDPDAPVVPPETGQAAQPTTPAPLPAIVPPPAPPPVAVEIPELLLDLPTLPALPELPMLPVQLPDPIELVSPPLQLPLTGAPSIG